MIKLHTNKKILALQKKQLENQMAQEEQQMQFCQKFVAEQRKRESEEKEKNRRFFFTVKYHS